MENCLFYCHCSCFQSLYTLSLIQVWKASNFLFLPLHFRVFLAVLQLCVTLYTHTGYNFSGDNFGTLSYHRIVESFKFTYAQRLGLGDPDYNDTIHQVSKEPLFYHTNFELCVFLLMHWKIRKPWIMLNTEFSLPLYIGSRIYARPQHCHGNVSQNWR